MKSLNSYINEEQTNKDKFNQELYDALPRILEKITKQQVIEGLFFAYPLEPLFEKEGVYTGNFSQRYAPIIEKRLYELFV